MCSDARHWPQTDRVWRQFGQLDLVMERTRVDPVLAARKAGGMALATARNICLTCLHHKQCRSLLDHDDGDVILSFCPNADFFDRCRRRGLHRTMATKRGG